MQALASSQALGQAPICPAGMAVSQASPASKIPFPQAGRLPPPPDEDEVVEVEELEVLPLPELEEALLPPAPLD